jgi:GrpB-like predicted nucleotidyltransferase (UPF0157 family)
MPLLRLHDPAWATHFADLQANLSRALGELALRIEHVGSTAVPDLMAKPILDIDVVMRDGAAFPSIVSALRRQGYVHRGDLGIPDREAFDAPGDTPMAHHLYVCPASSRELRRHVAFRDALRARPELRREYESIKLDIARRARGDRKVYAEIKERECRALIERVLADLLPAPGL